MADQDVQVVEEVEILESSTPQVASADGSDAALLLRIEEMVRTHLSQIDNLDTEITKYKDMLDDIFGNDQVYQEHDKVAKEAAKIRSATKAQIMKRPDVADLSNKMKDLKTEQAELKDGLSDYLREYQRLSGLNEIEDDKGELMEIIYVPKLVRKSQFRP
jgi:hypothetical protein